MAAALCKKAAGKAVSPHMLRPITRSYVDLDVWDNTDELPATGFHAGEKLPTNKDFVKCTFENGKFISPWPQREKGLLALLKWQMTPKKGKIVFPNMRGANSDTAIRPVPIRKSKMFVKDRPHVTWIGHATCSFQLEGVNFITDPVFSNTCSPVDMIGELNCSRWIAPPLFTSYCNASLFNNQDLPERFNHLLKLRKWIWMSVYYPIHTTTILIFHQPDG